MNSRKEEEADSVEDQEVADGAGDGEDSRVGFVVDGAPGEEDREEAEAVGVFALLEARLRATRAVEEKEAPVVAFVAAGDGAEGPEDVRDAAELGGAGLGLLVAVEGAQGEEGGAGGRRLPFGEGADAPRDRRVRARHGRRAPGEEEGEGGKRGE